MKAARRGLTRNCCDKAQGLATVRLSATLYLASVILKPPYILDVSLRGQIKWPDELGVALFSRLGLRPLEDSSRRAHGRAGKGPDPTEVL